MRILKRRSEGSMFKRQFTLMTATMLLCIFAAGFSLMFFFVNFWKNDRLTSLADDALSLAQSVDFFYAEHNDEISSDSVKAIISDVFSSSHGSDGAAAFITDTDGKILVCSDGSGSAESCPAHGTLPFPANILEQCRETDTTYTFDEVVQGFGDENTTYLCAVVPFSIRTDEVYYSVCMQSLISAYLPYTTEFVRMIILTGLIAVLISFLASLAVSLRMVKPIKKITAVTHKYGEGNFSERISELDTYSELAELAEAFNSMADNLAVTEQSRSNFVANVSHELKTPMTIISGFVDGMLDGTVPEEERNKYLKIVSDEVKRLSRLVVAMLNMSKIEAGKLTPTLLDVNLAELICRTVIGFEKVVTDRRIRVVGLDSLESVTAAVDGTLITQVVYNLFDNAVKFTPDGGTVTLSLGSDKKNAVIKIRNSGKGISAEEQTLVFDRFYKVDKSRGLDSKSFGMGLYIVKSIIELHHGTISINSELNDYTEFVIKLPLQSG